MRICHVLCIKYEDNEDEDSQDVDLSVEAVVAADAATNPAVITVASGAMQRLGLTANKTMKMNAASSFASMASPFIGFLP